MFVVIAPSSQNGVEMRNHHFRFHRPMRFEPGSDIFQEPENLILLREGEAPSPKVSDMEPEEIDPLFDRNNAGLFFTEGETSDAQPFFKDRLDRLNVFSRGGAHQ